METEIQTKRCFLGFDCIEKQCPAWTTFTDVEQGVCAFRIGSSAMRMMPGILNEITGILKKLSLLVFLFLVFAQPVLSQDTWIENKKYIDEKFSNLEKSNNEIKTDLKAYRDDIKIYTDKQNKLELEHVNISGEINPINNSLYYLSTIVYAPGGLIGGSALFGGGTAIRNSRRKKLSNLKKVIDEGLTK